MAVTVTARELSAQLPNTDAARATQLLAAASALVLDYAPDAPDALHDEAVIRCAGWLRQQPAASVQSRTAGPMSASYATSGLSALRHSGAMALLTRSKRRRGGLI